MSDPALQPVPVSQLSDDQRALFEQAVAVARRAYCPYSNFEVGCALQTTCGKIFVGCNIENAAYTPCTCAERSALSSAVSSGYRSFSTVAVFGRRRPQASTATSSDEPVHAAVSATDDAAASSSSAAVSPQAPVTAPCGVCRQTLYEFQCVGGHPLTMIMGDPAAQKVVVAPLNTLLPLAFGPVDIKVDVSHLAAAGQTV
eukprot:TRINITY_DN24475_c0_g1_i1.p1 TRINITY_DN24475_c0_g1~~TRINITY_DN24475_c0_g1_i1.p1  ORF type:complete len:226 (-),score=2.53 TRINITY_DN24475_c0_g1_i1:91-690(-)